MQDFTGTGWDNEEITEWSKHVKWQNMGENPQNPGHILWASPPIPQALLERYYTLGMPMPERLYQWDIPYGVSSQENTAEYVAPTQRINEPDDMEWLRLGSTQDDGVPKKKKKVTFQSPKPPKGARKLPVTSKKTRGKTKVYSVQQVVNHNERMIEQALKEEERMTKSVKKAAKQAMKVAMRAEAARKKLAKGGKKTAKRDKRIKGIVELESDARLGTQGDQLAGVAAETSMRQIAAAEDKDAPFPGPEELVNLLYWAESCLHSQMAKDREIPKEEMDELHRISRTATELLRRYFAVAANPTLRDILYERGEKIPTKEDIKKFLGYSRLPNFTIPGQEANIQMVGKTARDAQDNRQQYAMRRAVQYTGEGGYFGGLIGNLISKTGIGKALGINPDIVSNIENKVLGIAANKLLPGALQPIANAALTAYSATGPQGPVATGEGPYAITGQFPATGRGHVQSYSGQGPYAGSNAFYEEGTNPDLIKGIAGIPLEGTTQKNQIVDPGSYFTRRPPTFEDAGDDSGDLIFSAREYLQDVIPSTTNFESTKVFYLNPGLSDTFPLLSQFAQFFNEYKIQGCLFTFRSLVTPGFATAQGSTMMATNYNASGREYGSKREVENSAYSVSGKVSDNLVMGIECAKIKTALGGGQLYVRTGPLVGLAQGDLHTYDSGFVQFMTQGVPGGTSIGEIWVEYRVRLSKLAFISNLPMAPGSGMSFTWHANGAAMPATNAAILWAGLAGSPSGTYNGPLPLNSWLTHIWPTKSQLGASQGTIANYAGEDNIDYAAQVDTVAGSVVHGISFNAIAGGTYRFAINARFIYNGVNAQTFPNIVASVIFGDATVGTVY
ncbi:MAG: hypothetical protein ACRDHZ_01345, partial [Ktedonobacteraceae bacterium]